MGQVPNVYDTVLNDPSRNRLCGQTTPPCVKYYSYDIDTNEIWYHSNPSCTFTIPFRINGIRIGITSYPFPVAIIVSNVFYIAILYGNSTPPYTTPPDTATFEVRPANCGELHASLVQYAYYGHTEIAQHNTIIHPPRQHNDITITSNHERTGVDIRGRTVTTRTTMYLISKY